MYVTVRLETPTHNLGWEIYINTHYTVALTPLVKTLATTEVETGPKILEHGRREALGKDIGELRSSWHMKKSHITDGDTLADKVEVELDMLRALMLEWVV
jgi:hypothetical protein